MIIKKCNPVFSYVLHLFMVHLCSIVELEFKIYMSIQVRLSGSLPSGETTTLTLKDYPLEGEGAVNLKNMALMPGREVRKRL